MCVCDRERTLAAASGDQLPAGCRGRLMKGLLASVTGVEISAAPPPPLPKGHLGLGGGEFVPAAWPSGTALCSPAFTPGAPAPDLQAGVALGHAAAEPMLWGRRPVGGVPAPVRSRCESDRQLKSYCPEARC